MNIQYLTVPFIGAFIGWLTNIIAIEMLFRPKVPIIIFGFRLPFTPGLIPANRDKILKQTAKKIVSVITDTLSSKKQDSVQYKLFNKILDSHWASYVFMPPRKRKALYDSICKHLTADSNTMGYVENIIFQQLKEYDASELETSVRALSHHSLRGIKFIGALSGLVVGLIALLGGNI